MNPKRKHLFKKRQETADAFSSLPRTQKMVMLFAHWGSQPFSNNGLVGIGTVGRWTNCVDKDWIQGSLVIQHNNITILEISKEADRNPRTTVYDIAYSDTLDDYMAALGRATKEKDDAKQKRIIKAKEQQLFEETRFDKGE